MHDIGYDGDDPEHERQDILDSIKKDKNPDEPEIVKQKNEYKIQTQRK